MRTEREVGALIIALARVVNSTPPEKFTKESARISIYVLSWVLGCPVKNLDYMATLAKEVDAENISEFLAEAKRVINANTDELAEIEKKLGLVDKEQE